MDVTVRRPWGLSRMIDRLPEAAADFALVLLDPSTQLAVFFDDTGARIDMGRHGTNKSASSGTRSGGGGDGEGPPKPQTTDDATSGQRLWADRIQARATHYGC
jgi:putative ATP-grasp target RiPP